MALRSRSGDIGSSRHPNTDCIVDSVSDGSHRWHNRHFTDSTHPIRMSRIRTPTMTASIIGKIQAGRHPIVEETGVCHRAFVIIDIFLRSTPSRCLDGTALDLSFNVTRMDGFSGILYLQCSEEFRLPGLLVYRHIYGVRCVGTSGTPRIYGTAADTGPPV